MYKNLFITAALCLVSFCATASDKRDNFDINNNGLIEIYDLQDLDAVRNTIGSDGAFTFYGRRNLCSAPDGCRGFELMQDLDFDTNADGKLDAADAFWNNGQGWLPIELRTKSINFVGRGHLIKNLRINRPGLSQVGLFGRIDGVFIYSLGITGAQVSVSSGTSAGILAAVAVNSTAYDVFVTGKVEGEQVGGLIGVANYVAIENAFSSASVTGSVRGGIISGVGGLVGKGSELRILNSYVNGSLLTNSKDAKFGRPGGLVGTLASGNISNSYWATDTTASAKAVDSIDLNNSTLLEVEGVTLAQLRCPTTVNDRECAPGKKLFVQWATSSNGHGYHLWYMGNSMELPALFLGGKLYRDDDRNSVPDEVDLTDTDMDSVPDVADEFPNIPHQIHDLDGDGLIDDFETDCQLPCILGYGLKIDEYPFDTDNDGAPNDIDTDLTADNGAPRLLQLGASTSRNATGALTEVRINTRDLQVIDAKSDTLTYEVFATDSIGLNDGKKLQNWQPVKDNWTVNLPSGKTETLWRATDASGNTSAPFRHNVYVYPSVGFARSEFLTGEQSDVYPEFAFATASPDLAVRLKLALVAEESTANAEDVLVLNHEIDASGPGFYPPRITVTGDRLSEPDEQLVYTIVEAVASDGTGLKVNLTPGLEKAKIIITDKNLPPDVFLQAKGSVKDTFSNADQNLMIEAITRDPNGFDALDYRWEGEGLTPELFTPNKVRIDTSYLRDGYTVGVVVTDNGQPPLTSKVKKIRFYADYTCVTPTYKPPGPQAGLDDSINQVGFSCDVPLVTSASSSSSSASSSSSSSSSSSASSSTSSSGNNSGAGGQANGLPKAGSLDGWLLAGLYGYYLIQRRKKQRRLAGF